jgi:Cu(I)/Ag(I) efflux system membrane fusion protein
MEIKYKNSIRVIAILLVGVFLGWLLFGGNSSNQTQGNNAEVDHEEHTTWTCSMHPQIRQSESGDCPICGMELIPLTQGDQTGDPEVVMMSDYAKKTG